MTMLSIALQGFVPEVRRMLRVAGSSLYAAFVWAALALATSAAWVLVMLLPRLSWRWAALRHSLRLCCRLTGYRITVNGKEHLPGKSPAVFVANHASLIDSLALAAMLPRPVSFVAKVELAENLFLRVAMNRLEAEFVERFDKQRGVEDARRIAQTAKEGRSLLFFPEGRLRRMPGLQAFHMGAFLCAADAGIAVVPIALRGTRSILRPGTWFPRPGAVSIVIGKPIHSSDALSPDTPWGVATILSQEAREHILLHCGEPDISHERS